MCERVANTRVINYYLAYVPLSLWSQIPADGFLPGIIRARSRHLKHHCDAAMKMIAKMETASRAARVFCDEEQTSRKLMRMQNGQKTHAAMHFRTI